MGSTFCCEAINHFGHFGTKNEARHETSAEHPNGMELEDEDVLEIPNLEAMNRSGENVVTAVPSNIINLPSLEDLVRSTMFAHVFRNSINVYQKFPSHSRVSELEAVL